MKGVDKDLVATIFPAKCFPTVLSDDVESSDISGFITWMYSANQSLQYSCFGENGISFNKASRAPQHTLTH